MGTGVYWEPFELSDAEYGVVTNAWKGVDLGKILRVSKKQRINFDFVFDDEILSIPKHLDYLERSRMKYEGRFWKPIAEQGSEHQPATAP